MPIKWSTLKVSEATDMLEERFNQIVEPLEEARSIAQESLNIENLPQYVDRHLRGLLSEIDRALGGSQWNPTGQFNRRLQSIRDALPEKAVKAEKIRRKYGSQQSLV